MKNSLSNDRKSLQGAPKRRQKKKNLPASYLWKANTKLESGRCARQGVSNCTIRWDSKVFIGLEDVKTLVTFQRRHHLHVLWPDLMVKGMWGEHYGTINSLLWTLAMQGKQEMAVVTEFSTSRNGFINEKSWTQFPLMTLGLPGDWISMPECMRVITKHFSAGSPSPIPLEKAKQALADSP